MNNKIIFIKNAKQELETMKNNLLLNNICKKTPKEVIKGEK